ncbi:penicillin-binding protein 1A [Alkalibacillus almallahensis]|uniref:penicillin-binding protein 1A n=1 Tax=Alkalibacillus almallahensis TaxID=1379154 RepID=UPI001421DCE5|nr:penicillin-binding protein 1A [Alkalibacillus almallahensis]NIK11034.1 penicillin-binding protein 1A [Alkalibacillus almallahensis]
MSDQVKSRKANKQKKKQNKKINWKKVFLTLLIIGLVMTLVGAGVVYSYISDAPELNEEELQVPAGTSILDRNGEEIANLATENRTVIEYSDLSPVVEDAVIATEDARFYEHSGIDIRRIGAAVIANIKEGFGAEGASTITQQVIKNFLLSDKKVLERKVQEQYLAIKLEQEYSKEQILMMYLNKIYYGNGIYGIQQASEYYYGKEDLNNLTLSEAALLAGLPQRPSGYNPLEHPERAQDRRDTVLDLMVHHDKITEQEAEEAKQVNVSDMVQENNESSEVNYPAFIETVYDEAEKLIEQEDLNIHTAGLTIHTTLDQDAQQQLKELLSHDSSAFPNNELEAGVTALDTKTGQVLAIGGGRNRTQPFNQNYATDIARAPGSAIKPIVSYGPVIDQNQFSTYHQYYDHPSEAYYSWDEEFENYGPDGGTYHNWVTMREALYRSLNVPAVINTREHLDREAAGEFARNLGISSVEGEVNDGMALGSDGENGIPTNSYEMAGAFAAFGNQGMYNEPHTITKIEFPDGRTMEPDRESTPVMEDYTAYMISDMLKDTIEHPNGTAAGKLNLGSLPVAGKTGTTNDTVDSWFVGYSTNYTISVWTGYDEQQEINDTSPRFTIFETLMTQLSEGEDTADFTKPDSVKEIGVEEGSRPAKLPSEYTPESEIVTELFVEGKEPSETSDQYEQIDPIESLQVDFNAEEENIEASWSHPSSGDVQFDISISANDQEVDSISGYGDTSYTFNNIEMGQTYTFEITAYDAANTENQSEPVTGSVEIPAEDSDFWEEFLDEEEDNQDENNQEEQNGEGSENNGDSNDQSDGNNNNESGNTGDSDSNNGDDSSGNENDDSQTGDDSQNSNNNNSNDNNNNDSNNTEDSNDTSDDEQNTSDDSNQDSN